MAIDPQAVVNQPGYKQGWPWFLFGLPALSVVIGIALYLIANYWNVDSIVAGDYSKDGKGVELLVDRQKHAQSLGLSARATVREDAVSVKLSAAQEKDLPTVLRLAIIHPTQDRFDQHLLLQRREDGVYFGLIEPLHASRWQFQLEDESRTWRMAGSTYLPAETEVSIEPFQSSRINQAEPTRPSNS
ncbi:MAG: FixH family protein [Azoarcus sp.]|jgi:hypothetical protein|nr:FixH family protein [Azoarcus sp.]